MTLNMGTTNYYILDITASNFLTQSNGFLTIINGTFKFETPNAITPFTTNTSIPLTGGMWVNNSSAVVTTTGGNLSVMGFVRVTNGVLNIGTAANQQLLSNGGTFIVEGGTVNVSGSFTSAPFAIMNFTISGGTFTVATVGSTLAGQGYGAGMRPSESVRRENHVDPIEHRPPVLRPVASAGPYGRGRRREPERQAGGIS